MADPYLSQLSAFELAELQQMFLEFGNTTITIYMSALFAYLLVSQFVISRISANQLVTISIIYSVFMLYLITTLFNVQINAYNIQRHMMELFPDSSYIIEIESIVPLLIIPVSCLLGWIVSLIYMKATWRNK